MYNYITISKGVLHIYYKHIVAFYKQVSICLGCLLIITYYYRLTNLFIITWLVKI